MTMFTRCTHCEAIFRVTLEQLQTSSGQVRCGVCENVFDAFVALSADDPRTDAEAAATEEVDFPPAPMEVELLEADGGPPQALDLDLSSGDEMPLADEPAFAQEAPRATRPAVPEPDEEDRYPSFEPFAVPQPVPTSSPAWAVLAVVLAVALVLQGAYFFRAEIAASWPETRSALETACVSLGCDVPLPRLADRLTIEASDLQALDPTRPNRVVLSATIRNRASLTQAWPMLELTLTNARDQVAARKVFAPEEYLEGGGPGRGIAANAEAGIRLRLDTADIVAAGYRIYLFHP